MKKDYINPECKTLNVKSRYGLMEEMTVSKGTISDESDIGFSKEQEYVDEEDAGGKSVWED